jgi:hypothetical protein
MTCFAEQRAGKRNGGRLFQSFLPCGAWNLAWERFSPAVSRPARIRLVAHDHANKTPLIQAGALSTVLGRGRRCARHRAHPSESWKRIGDTDAFSLHLVFPAANSTRHHARHHTPMSIGPWSRFVIKLQSSLQGESDTEVCRPPASSGHVHRFCAVARCLIDQEAPGRLGRFRLERRHARECRSCANMNNGPASLPLGS